MSIRCEIAPVGWDECCQWCGWPFDTGDAGLWVGDELFCGSSCARASLTRDGGMTDKLAERLKRLGAEMRREAARRGEP